jgi:hypothetical protein
MVELESKYLEMGRQIDGLVVDGKIMDEDQLS